MLSTKDILLDLFYQVTDFQSKDVEWHDVNEAMFNELDCAILMVKMKCGKLIKLSTMAGNVHVVVHETRASSA